MRVSKGADSFFSKMSEKMSSLSDLGKLFSKKHSSSPKTTGRSSVSSIIVEDNSKRPKHTASKKQIARVSKQAKQILSELPMSYKLSKENRTHFQEALAHIQTITDSSELNEYLFAHFDSEDEQVLFDTDKAIFDAVTTEIEKRGRDIAKANVKKAGE